MKKKELETEGAVYEKAEEKKKKAVAADFASCRTLQVSSQKLTQGAADYYGVQREFEEIKDKRDIKKKIELLSGRGNKGPRSLVYFHP